MHGYRISTNKSEFDLDAIHAFISRTYWAAGMPKPLLAKAIENSFCFAVFTDAGEQIGFARVITDYATYAYLSDVYILEAHRGQGLSKWLVQTVVAHAELQGLRRFNLFTADAHGLYQQFGFKSLTHPERGMEIFDAGVYQRAGT